MVSPGESPARTASSALEELALVDFAILRNVPGAEASCRRALALSPGLDRAWELLVSALVQAERFEDLAAACKDRLLIKNGPTRSGDP